MLTQCARRAITASPKHLAAFAFTRRAVNVLACNSRPVSILASTRRSSSGRPFSPATLITPLQSSIPTRPVRSVAAMAASSDKKVLVPISNGCEEMEAVIVIDVLRRAGAKVTVASVEHALEVTCSRGVKLVADKIIQDCAADTYDLIACPGGMPGAERLRDSAVLDTMMQQQASSGRLYAAICATPYVFLEAKGLLRGKKATAHPAFSDKLTDKSAANSRVVVDGTLTTSRGPGTAFEFALSLVQQLYGDDVAKQVAGPMVMYDYKL